MSTANTPDTPESEVMHELDSFHFPNQYEPVEVLSHTPQSLVVLAHDIMRGQDVALKILTDLAADARERFGFEVQITMSNDHPHLLRGLESGEMRVDGDDQLRPFMVLPFVPTNLLDLAQSIRSGMPRREVEDLIVQTAVGLHVFHQRDPRKNLHRDVKPSNYVITAEGVVQLIDFGFARVRSNIRSVLAEETVLGTARYMSPEQWRLPGRDLTLDSDWFGFAAMWYYLLTGRFLFEVEKDEDQGPEMMRFSKDERFARRQLEEWDQQLIIGNIICTQVRQRLMLMLRSNKVDRFVDGKNVPRALARASMRGRGEGPKGFLDWISWWINQD